MTFSEKFAVPIVIDLWALLEPLVPLEVLEPLELHAAARRAKARRLAPTAPFLCNRIGRHPSC
jgi:hypothetical protein